MQSWLSYWKRRNLQHASTHLWRPCIFASQSSVHLCTAGQCLTAPLIRTGPQSFPVVPAAYCRRCLWASCCCPSLSQEKVLTEPEILSQSHQHVSYLGCQMCQHPSTGILSYADHHAQEVEFQKRIQHGYCYPEYTSGRGPRTTPSSNTSSQALDM